MSGVNYLMEDIYRDIIDSIESGIVVIDEERKVILFNQSSERITGISKVRALNSAMEEVFYGSGRVLEQIKRTSETGKVFSDHDAHIVKKSGPFVPVSLVTSPVIKSDGRRGGTVLVISDISRVKDLEEDVRRSDSLASIGVLAAGLAHEIKNPLGGIRGAAQLIEMETGNNAELKEYTSLIIRETDRVCGLIEELLDFANPKSLNLKEVNIHEVLDSVIKLLSRSSEGEKVSFLTEYDPSIPPLACDRDKLSQVFINLVKNGCEAMDGEGTLKVVTKIVGGYLLNEKEGGFSKMMAVELSDEGKGIPEDEMKLIFTPFFSRKKGGTGLGLAVSHRIIKEHGGTVKVKNNPDGGATFSVFLPLKVML